MMLIIGMWDNAAYRSKLYNKQCTASDSVKKHNNTNNVKIVLVFWPKYI